MTKIKGKEGFIVLARTFLGFMGGALVAAFFLHYRRTGTIDLAAVAHSLQPTFIGAGLGLVVLLVLVNVLTRGKK